jgi:arylsulfatase A-like enzyme
LAGFFILAGGAMAATRPNIVYILADDMGVGDVSALNAKSAWQTPHLDRLAQEGIAFTDAHSSSAVCTPSRYAIMTGRYNWRSARKSGVGSGFSPALIEPGRMTVPSFLAQHGYATAMIGKWHLGLNWVPWAEVNRTRRRWILANRLAAGRWRLVFSRSLASVRRSTCRRMRGCATIRWTRRRCI